MSDAGSRVVESYLQDARADLQLAELAMGSGNRLGAEHLYRAAEKLVKAIRISRGLDATKEHDLEQLVVGGDRPGQVGLPESDPWCAKLRDLFWLTQFATAYRYPTTTGKLKEAPPPERQREVIALISQLLEEAGEERLR